RTPVPAHSPLKPTCDDGAVDDVQKPLDAFPWPPRGSKRLSLHSKKLIIDTDSLLDSRLTDPMEVLINLGFGKPDQEKIQRIPQRFLKSSEVSGNDMEEFVRSEYSNMAKSERVLGLNLQVSCRTSNVTSPLLLQIIERLQECRSEQRMAKTTPAEPEPKLHGRARFSSLIKNIRDMNRGCTGFQSTIRNSPSVLHPENRHLLDLQGQKSPELKRRLVIGQQKYDLCKDGKLIEHKNNANLDKNRMQEEGQLKEKEDGYKSDKYKENNKEDDEKCEIPATSIESNEEEIKIPTKSSYQEATPQALSHSQLTGSSPPSSPTKIKLRSFNTMHENKKRQDIIFRMSRSRSTKVSISSVDDAIPEKLNENETGYHPSENPDLSNPLTMQSTSSGLSSQPSRKSFSARGIYPHHCTSRHTTKKVKATDHAVSLEPIGIQGGGRHLKHQNRIEALLSQKWHFVLWIAMCVWTIISVM
ncbi:unnamed protein product, partial [Meganyctiphanes norvegica]